MRTNVFTAAIAVACMGAPLAQAAPQANVEQGGNLFSITCSSSFCHGDGGIGARGPSLRNRNFTPDFVRNTILQGRSGTPMPSFKDSIAPDELAMIVAYVMSLSPNNHAVDSGVAPTPAPPAATPLGAQASRGLALFFDAARPAECALCHSYQEKGGPIGADLSGIAKKSPRDIYQSMVKPDPSNAAYLAIAVTTRDGKRIEGIKQEQTDELVRLYDLSSAPPVLRSFYKADGVKSEALAKALYSHDLTGYSKDDLAAIVAFLKSADGGAGKDVTAADIGQQ